MKDSYHELDFSVTDRAVGPAGYANGDHIRLVNLGPIAIFNKYRLTSGSGREIEELDKPHVNSLIYKTIKTSKISDDLSIGFHRDITTLKKLNNNKKSKGVYHARLRFRGVFSFAEHQNDCTYGLGLKKLYREIVISMH